MSFLIVLTFIPNIETMPFEVGDKVKYLNEEGGGLVLRIVDEYRLEIIDEHGFDYIIKKSEVVSEGKSSVDEKTIKDKLKGFHESESKVHDSQLHNPEFQKIITDYLMSSRQYWTSKDKDFIEIDLHIEEIVDKPRHMNDGQKLHFQLDHARYCLEEILNIGMKRVVFIHGVGGGVLRHELRKWLNTIQYLDIVNANYHRYGIGATEVRIKMNI